MTHLRPLFLVFLLSFLWRLPQSHGADLPGHMQPLGGHRPPEAVTRLTHVPSAEEFHNDWEKAGQPVVLEGILSRTEVFRNWQQDDYLRTQFGEEMMNVEQGKKENRSEIAFHISMASFLDRYQQEDIYMVSDMPQAMRREWLLPKFLLCGGYTQHLMFVYLWFSSGGTKSVLHTDSYENLHCLVSGRKEFILIEPKYNKTIGPELEEMGYYPINVDSVNMTARPGLAEVPWYKATVNQGDCLYLPYEWIHHVRSYDRNFGVNVWWIPFNFNAEECSPPNVTPDFASLGDFQVAAEMQIKFVLKDLADEDGIIRVEDLFRMMNEETMVVGITLQNAREVFEILDPGCGDSLQAEKLDSIPFETYKAAHHHIMVIQDKLIESRNADRNSDPEEEFQPVDPDYLDFGGDLDEGEEFGGYGHYDFEDPEHDEGGGDFGLPSQHERDEL